MTSATCPACGATWRPNAKFCGTCGEPAPGAVADTPTTGGPSPSTTNNGVVVAVVVAMVAIAGIAVGVALGTRGQSDESTGDGPGTTAVRVDASLSTTTSTSVPPTSPPSTDPPVTDPPGRPASLFSDEAILRSGPSTDASEIRRFEDRSGMPLTVLAPIDDSGWYRVRADGTEGYLFGAFVTPPDSGYCVAEAISGEPPITDDHGTVIVAPGSNPSGSKVLLAPGTVLSSSIWPVLLADGRRDLYVQAEDMRQPLC